MVDNIALYELMALAANEQATDEVRAIAGLELADLKDWLNAQNWKLLDFPEHAHYFYAVQQIDQFEKDPKHITVPTPQPPPDGSPIGTLDDDEL